MLGHLRTFFGWLIGWGKSPVNYGFRWTFQFEASGPSIGSNLETGLRNRGWHCLYSPTNQDPNAAKRAQVAYKAIYKSVENFEMDFVFESGSALAIILPSWEVVVLSNNEDDVFTFASRLVSQMTLAMQQDVPQVISPETSRRIERWLFVAIFLASIPGLLSDLIKGVLGIPIYYAVAVGSLLALTLLNVDKETRR